MAVVGVTFISIVQGLLLLGDANFVESSVCTTRACREEAQRIKRDIDETIDPCEDFYKFSCGNYVKHNNESYESRLWETKDAIKKTLLTGHAILPGYRTQSLMVSLYKSCMNTSYIEELGLKPVLSIFKAIGGWPVIEKSNVPSMNFTDILFKLWQKKMYVDAFFSIVVPTTDHGISGEENIDTIERIKISCMDTGKYFMTDGKYDVNKSEAYYQYMNETAILFGAKPNVAARDMRNVWELESTLNNLTCKSFENATAISFGEMDLVYEGINWTNFLTSFLEPFSDVYRTLPFYVMAPEYLKNVMPIIANTTSRTLLNYIGWNVIKKFPQYLNENMTKLYTKYCGESRCHPDRGRREAFCVKAYKASFKLTEELEFAYEKMYIPESTIAKAAKLSMYVQDQLRRSFASSTWIGAKLLLKLTKRINNTYLVIGFPPNWNTSTVDELYKELFLEENNFYLNMLNTTAFNILHSDRKVMNKGIYQNELLDKGTFIVNRSYEIADKNDAYCQSIYFNDTRPDSMNYAGLGSQFVQRVMKNYIEEIVYPDENEHAEESKASENEKESESENASEDETDDENNDEEEDDYNRGPILKEKMNCFKERYENASVYAEEEVDWDTISIDVLRIFTGIVLGHRSYILFEGGRNGSTLPGLNFTSQQLYWVNSGRDFCSREYHDGDSQSRIANFTNFFFSTSSDFRTDWSCPSSSKMSFGRTCDFM